MREIFVPWAAWYGKAPFKMEFPDHWEVEVHHMRGGPDIGDAGIRQGLQEAIGAPPLREFARGRSSAAILVDDLSRPDAGFSALALCTRGASCGRDWSRRRKDHLRAGGPPPDDPRRFDQEGRVGHRRYHAGAQPQCL